MKAESQFPEYPQQHWQCCRDEQAVVEVVAQKRPVGPQAGFYNKAVEGEKK
jgi:hypothetical protein